MAEHVTGFQTPEGVKKYDYHSLANKPESFSNALKGSARGKVVRVDDVSPVKHNISVTVHGKNLFDISKIETFNHITNNGDGTITVTTDSNSSGSSSNKALKRIAPHLKVGDICTLSATTTGTAKYIYLSNFGTWDFGTQLEMTQEMLDSTVYFYASGVNTSAVISNIQIERGTSATAYEPYIDASMATVTKCGKNMFNLDTMLGENASVSDGVIYSSYNVSAANIPVVKGEQYTISAYVYSTVVNESILALSVQDGYEVGYTSEANSIATVTGVTTTPTLKTVTFTALSDYVSISTNVRLKSNIMIELGETATEYEPYICTTYVPNEDGIVEGVLSSSPTMTFTTDTANTVIEIEYQRDINILTKTVPLIDRVTGIPYYLYVSDGKLQIEEREV